MTVTRGPKGTRSNSGSPGVHRRTAIRRRPHAVRLLRAWDGSGRGRDRAGAHAQADALNARTFARLPPQFRFIELHVYTAVTPLQEALTGSVRRVLYLLWAGAGFVLLIGALNIANLSLARTSVRARELATRMAQSRRRPASRDAAADRRRRICSRAWGALPVSARARGFFEGSNRAAFRVCRMHRPSPSICRSSPARSHSRC